VHSHISSPHASSVMVSISSRASSRAWRTIPGVVINVLVTLAAEDGWRVTAFRTGLRTGAGRKARSREAPATIEGRGGM